MKKIVFWGFFLVLAMSLIDKVCIWSFTLIGHCAFSKEAEGMDLIRIYPLPQTARHYEQVDLSTFPGFNAAYARKWHLKVTTTVLPCWQ